ncbi:MAG: hypothetical protein KA354_04740 [Phycisphaerae bacterium]|nr:hypothetical protein [Phycisphaerae bacterium]
MDKRLSTTTRVLVLAAVMTVTTTSLAQEKTATSEAEYAKKIDSLLPGMGAERLVDRREPQMAFEKICFEASAPGKPAEREALCKALIAKVGPEVAKPARIWLLRKVETIGRDEVVAGLAKLFGDPDADIRETARRALENNPSPGAAGALRAELDKAKDANWQVALINALAFRRDTGSVGMLTRLTESQEDAVALAAVSALGRIADEPALNALAALRRSGRPALKSEVIDASLRGAEALAAGGQADLAAKTYEELDTVGQAENIRVAALTGYARAQGVKALPKLMAALKGPDQRMQLVAARCLQGLPGKEASGQMAAAIEGAPPATQAVLLGILGERKDAAILPTVLKKTDDANADVRVAALGALKHVGGPGQVTMLAERAIKTKDAEAAAARDALAMMQGADVDKVVVAGTKAGDLAVRAELVRTLGTRRMRDHMVSVFAAAYDKEEAIQIAALDALAILGRERDYLMLVDLVANLKTDAARKAGEKAVVEVARKVADKSRQAAPILAVLPRAPIAGKAVMIRVLNRLELADVKVLEVLLPCLDDEAVRADAAQAVVAIAARLGGQEKAVAALERIREVGPTDNLRKQATESLDRLRRFCVAWLFSGPYREKDADATKHFDTVFEPEKADSKAKWKALPAPARDAQGRCDLGGEQNCVGYVKTTIVSDKDQDAQLVMGSDDGLKVFLNGKVVHAVNVIRAFPAELDKASIKLRKGDNSLLLKITQGGGEWQFSCAVTAPNGEAITGVKYEAR